MKIYPIIVINKSDMRKVEHFKNADLAALSLARMDGKVFNKQNWIVIKDETTVVDFSKLPTMAGIVSQHGLIRKLIEDS